MEKITEIAALSKEDRMKYDESIKVYRDIKATLAFSREEGRAEGRAEGMKEIAQNMKALGVDSEIIMKATGFTPKEIEEL